jgi:hypothetical protein
VNGLCAVNAVLDLCALLPVYGCAGRMQMRCVRTTLQGWRQSRWSAFEPTQGLMKRVGAWLG